MSLTDAGTKLDVALVATNVIDLHLRPEAKEAISAASNLVLLFRKY